MHKTLQARPQRFVTSLREKITLSFVVSDFQQRKVDLVGAPVDHRHGKIVPIIIFIFNLLGVSTYPGVYDKFLIIVGLGINALTVWYAWKWI